MNSDWSIREVYREFGFHVRERNLANQYPDDASKKSKYRVRLADAKPQRDTADGRIVTGNG